jgi:hypothetical protein
MVKDQRHDAERLLERARAARPRARTLARLAVPVIAIAVIVVPHFSSSSPTTNEDTDPTNGVPHSLPAP